MQVRSLLRVVRMADQTLMPIGMSTIQTSNLLCMDVTSNLLIGVVSCLQSVFHVSYLRGLFDEQSFKAVNMDNLEGAFPGCTLSAQICSP
jgi:hypothetical protein